MMSVKLLLDTTPYPEKLATILLPSTRYTTLWNVSAHKPCCRTEWKRIAITPCKT